jgi:hypothetical protein
MPIQMAYNLRDRYEFESVYGDFSSSVPLVLTLQPHFSLRHVWVCMTKHCCKCSNISTLILLHCINNSPLKGGMLTTTPCWASLAVDSNDRDTFVDVTTFAQRLLPMSLDEREPVAPLWVGLLKTHGKLSLPFIYDRRHFSPDLISRLVDHVLVLLDMMVEQPELKVEDIPVPIMLAERLLPEDISPLTVLDVHPSRES